MTALPRPLFLILAALAVLAVAALCVWLYLRSRRLPPEPPVDVPGESPRKAASLPTLISIGNPVEAVRLALREGDLAAEEPDDAQRFLDTSPLPYQPSENQQKQE
jgi:hypothetical protein